MAAHYLVGIWELVSCHPTLRTGETVQQYGIEGTTFRLDDTGDVTWTLPTDKASDIPLFSCETYEIHCPSHGLLLLKFGACSGHLIEFKVDQPDPPNVMVLSCENWCVLHCLRLPENDTENLLDAPFTLIPALEDGYFSDLSITASNGKQFAVHTCIVALVVPELDWSHAVPPLSGLPEDVLGTILHYIYSESLPSNLSECTARQVATTVAKLPSPTLGRLKCMCETYIKNMLLRQEIISLVSDMHACGTQIIENFSGSKGSSNAHLSESLKSNPVKLCYVIKQSVREVAVAAVKFHVLCDVFTKRKKDLSLEDRHEIIRYAESRFPVFMNQLHRFLQAVNSTFRGMSPSQRYDVATYLVPEIEAVFDFISELGIEVQSALDQMIHSMPLIDGQMSKYGAQEMLSKSLHQIFHVKELSKLRRIHQWVTYTLAWLAQRKERISEMTNSMKVRSIARTLEELMEELPVFLFRLMDLEDAVEWQEFKFCVKVGISKVSGWIHLALSHKEKLQEVLVRLCDLIQRDEFAKSLLALGLLDPSHYSANSHSADSSSPDSSSATQSTPKQHANKLNLVEALCVPPMSCKSHLSKLTLPLLKSGAQTDMVFEVVPPQDGGIDHTTNTTETMLLGQDKKEELFTLEAHRVIVAARCDWFRRALQSGMREAIDRKIVIHDTSPFLFTLFLDYLYSGFIDAKELSVDQLADLMMLSDRYEVDRLKLVCEEALRAHIDSDSVLYFLSLADQFNAVQLKNACLYFVARHTEVIASELFDELPHNLQAEIYDLSIWAKPLKSETTEKLVTCSQCPSPDTSRSSSMADIEDMVSNLHINTHRVDHSDSSSLEELPITQDSVRLEACIRALSDIVGDDVPRNELIQLALAADYDVNRAANFYYEHKKLT